LILSEVSRAYDNLRIEKVQMRATKKVSSVKVLSYKDRIKILKLLTLKFRRIKGDMIEVYKVINQYYDKNTTITFDFVGNSVTRGNKYKLRQSHCKYDLRRHYRILAIWNSLPEYVDILSQVKSICRLNFVVILTAEIYLNAYHFRLMVTIFNLTLTLTSKNIHTSPTVFLDSKMID